MNLITYYLLILISMATLIHLANTHGIVLNPPPRDGLGNAQGCISYFAMYHNSFKCDNVCGNPGFDSLQTGLVDKSENTGPVRATYLSGQTFLMEVKTIVHAGYFRVRLCKLKSSTDIVTQDCLDQNLLEITNNETQKLQLDKYTVRKNGAANFDLPAQKMLVKLPDGLSCTNCVLQWEWTSNGFCSFQNGTRTPESNWCLGQTYKNCMDIRIDPNPSRPNAVYVPNLAKNNPLPTSYYPPIRPKVFAFNANFKMKRDKSGKQVHNTNPDPLKFIGDGLRCFLDEDIAKTMSQTQIDDLHKTCRENCMTPDKKCPDTCFCRWFKAKTN